MFIREKIADSMQTRGILFNIDYTYLFVGQRL